MQQPQYFVEQAYTYYEAEKKAREKYGERVKILGHETVKIPGGFLNLFSREGIKITGIIPKFGSAGMYGDTQSEPYSSGNPPSPNKPLDFAQEKEKLLALATAGKENALKDANLNSGRPAGSPLEPNINFVNALADVKKEVLAEVKLIKDKLENQGLTGSVEEHPALNRLDDILILNDFPASYRKAILERARNDFSPNELGNYDSVQDKVLEWIGESIKIFENDKFKIRPRIMILIGPTGVGKTTTVAKLAANFGINEKGRHKRRIVLVTIDAYRIGAREQLERYSEVMEFPCFSVGDYGELKKAIALNSERTDLILIDTIGKNPRDVVQLGEMKQLLDACGSLPEFHLAVAATTKASDLKEILQHFEFFNYRSVIVTKMDETIRTGNIIGTLSEMGKSVSYITNGQKVPTDIQKASAVQFLINLEGFKVNRIKLEEMFPDKGQEYMQQWSSIKDIPIKETPNNKILRK